MHKRDPCTRPQIAGGRGNGTKNSFDYHASSRHKFHTHAQTQPKLAPFLEMGVHKRVRKFAKVKRVIGQQDARLYTIHRLAPGLDWLTLFLPEKRIKPKARL